MLDLSGKTVAIVGGGPSLKGYDFTALRERDWPIIAVNNSYRLFPDAVACFFADARWWKHHQTALLANFQGQLVTSTADHTTVKHPRLHRLQREYKAPLSKDPQKVAGYDSGTQSVNYAYLCGAREIVLFGFDMTYVNGESHWHSDHVWATTQKRYEVQFAPRLANMALELNRLGIRLTRATEPGLPSIKHVAL